jgi:hypothetical protein
MKPKLRLAPSLLLAVTLVLLTPIAAAAGEGNTTTGGGPGGSAAGDPGSGPGGAAGPDPVIGTESGSEKVSGCTLFANPSSFGETCPARRSGNTRTWRQILGRDPFPRCKVSPLPADIVPPRNPKGQAGTWMVQTCLDNVGVNGVTPGQTVGRSVELVFFPAGTRIPTLTAGQETIWNSLVSDYPTPAVVFTPVQPPRVNVPTSFHLTAFGDDVARTSRVTLTTADGRSLSTLTISTVTGRTNVPLRAYVTRTYVWPGISPGEFPTDCDGAGVVRPATDRPAAGDPCTLTYTRSSAHLPDDVYTLTIEADWTVEFQNPDGTWQALATNPVTTTFRSPVDEIQTIITS